MMATTIITTNQISATGLRATFKIPILQAYKDYYTILFLYKYINNINTPFTHNKLPLLPDATLNSRTHNIKQTRTNNKYGNNSISKQ